MQTVLKVAVAALGTIGMLAVGSPASAHAAMYETRVEMAFQDREPSEPGERDRTDRFAGQLVAATSACETNRRVTLFRRLPGGDLQRIGSVVSGANGGFSFRVEDPPNGNYVASVAQERRVSTPQHCHWCTADRSRRVVVETS